jgi:ribose/xylose/arabinose/galactoside ABC-type transport system permease subunit
MNLIYLSPHRLIRHFSWLLCAVLIVAFVIWVPAFRRLAYWQELPRLYFAVAALALVLTPVILTGGIDLSVGAVALFSSMVVGLCLETLNWPLPVALAAGVAVGLAAGMANGVLVVIGIPSLVATLATRELFRGLAVSVSAGRTIQFGPELTATMNTIWEGNWFGLPLPLLGLFVLFALTYLLVHHTWMGRMLFAVGDNREAARFAAVPVRKLEFGCFAAVGLVAGLCGACSVLRYTSARPDGEANLELLAIAAVVLGGVRITGGAGHVAGTLLGIITLAVLLAGLQRVQASWRDAITGVLLLTVALANEAAARWAERRKSSVVRSP